MPVEFLENEFELSNEFCTAKVSAIGASITELVIDGVGVIAHVTKAAHQQAFASVTLAPWPNRLAGGVWNFGGVELHADLNDPKGNANHGTVFGREFTVRDRTQSSISFSTELGQDEIYPFTVELNVSYNLIERELVCTIEAKNLSDLRAPIAFGSHPYLTVQPDSQILISAKTQLVNNEQQIPIGLEEAMIINPAPNFENLHLDDCFTDLIRNEEGKATTAINHTDGSSVELWQDSKFKYLMVYTNRTLSNLGVDVLAIAIEPQTSPADALNSGTDLVWLSAGERSEASWGIRVNSGKQNLKGI